jgi:hypothetical protein
LKFPSHLRVNQAPRFIPPGRPKPRDNFFDMVPNTKHGLKKLETLAKELGYTVRYEKGNFQSGYCLVESRRIAIINKFFDTEARVSCLLDILSQYRNPEAEPPLGIRRKSNPSAIASVGYCLSLLGLKNSVLPQGASAFSLSWENVKTGLRFSDQSQIGRGATRARRFLWSSPQ